MREADSPSPSPEQRVTDPVAAALGVGGEDRQDIQAGRGRGYGILDEAGSPFLSLETFESGVVRVTTSSSRLELIDFGSPAIAPECVVWKRDGSFLSVSKQGELDLHLARPVVTGPETPEDMPEIEKDGIHPEEQIPVFRRDSVAPGSPLQNDTPSETQMTEKEERVKLFGRLGRDPSFRVTASKKLVGQFPLAVRLDDEKVKWEMVVAHGARAEKLRDQLQLKKGQSVEVIGYRHQQRRKDRKGQERIDEEIYIVAVIPR